MVWLQVLFPTVGAAVLAMVVILWLRRRYGSSTETGNGDWDGGAWSDGCGDGD